jgi:magnesium chelatase subunit D
VTQPATPWRDALVAATLLALDPVRLGGAVLRGPPGPARDAWLARLRSLLPAEAPWRRLPPNVPDSRLLGGLNLAASLSLGRRVAEPGLLAEADGGVLLAAMAERMDSQTAARLVATLDSGEVAVQREGLSQRLPARLAVVALDEGLAADEITPAALRDRLAFVLEPGAPETTEVVDLTAARALLPEVGIEAAGIEALCAAALALGIDSLRAPVLALAAARAAAALEGRRSVGEDDLVLAARLVLAPRATRLPAAEDAADTEGQADGEAAGEPQHEREPPPADQEQQTAPATESQAPLQEMVLAAARAAIPPGLLAALVQAASPGRAKGAEGRTGVSRQPAKRGRPLGSRPGSLRPGLRLNLVETLRAAAPWQPLRQAQAPSGRIIVRPADFRLRRFQHRRRATTVFMVDASGSAALHRLAEAKGAVELLLADCYARRDHVAVIAFRGTSAELLLPPTASLTRARRSLAGLPGGGGTPLAAALQAATTLALALRRRGDVPMLVLLSDGRANVALDGTGGRPRAEAEALAAARAVGLEALAALVLDTSPRPGPAAQAIATAMGARYVPLPFADASAMSGMVQAARPA